MDKKTIMIALGGNSLSPKGSSGTVGEQFSFTRKTMDHLSEFILKDYNIYISHGNRPQVGNELLRMDLTNDIVPPPPNWHMRCKYSRVDRIYGPANTPK